MPPMKTSKNVRVNNRGLHLLMHSIRIASNQLKPRYPDQAW